MKRLILFIFSSFIFFSVNIYANEDLSGSTFICSDIFWAFEFKQSKKVKVYSTDINNETKFREFYYEISSELPYINIFLMENNIRNLIYSVHRKTLRVDIWTMTSGGNTTREIIPEYFCKIKNISNVLNHIEKLKENN